MKTVTVPTFDVIGLAVRTTNENGQAAVDIPLLWGKFMTENILSMIPNKIENTIYCIYTDYERDHTKPYQTILGCKVDNLDVIPAGLTGKSVEGGHYTQFTAKGNLAEGAVFQEWTRIWNTDLPRLYAADFEVYGEKAQDPGNAEIDIFISVD